MSQQGPTAKCCRRDACATGGGLIFHPWFFALFPLLSLFSANTSKVEAGELLVPSLLALLLTTLLWFVLWPLLPNTRKRGVMVTLLMLLFLFYGGLVDRVRLFADSENLLSGASLALACGALVLLMTLLITMLRKSRRTFAGTTRFLNAVSTIAVLVASGTAGWGIVQGHHPRTTGTEPVAPQASATRADALPDIFFIILDGYGRSDILREMYGFDNRDFLKQLEVKGFYIANESNANYAQTRLSLASSLNMMHLTDLPELKSVDGKRATPLLSEMIRHANVTDFLRRRGYEFVSFNTGFSETETPDADRYLKPPVALTEFQNELISMTPLRSVLNRLRVREAAQKGQYYWQHDLHRDRILFTLDQLKQLKRVGKPMFVFAHVPAPHPPFVLGELGEAVYPAMRFTVADGSGYVRDMGGDQKEYIEGYRKQAVLISQKTDEAVAAILANNPNTVIVVQGDHGPGAHLDWDSTENTNLRERMGILNAIYLPGKNSAEVLYPTMTPVNTFRIVLNAYFGASQGLLPDEVYFSTLNAPGVFLNVTERLSIRE